MDSSLLVANYKLDYLFKAYSDEKMIRKELESYIKENNTSSDIRKELHTLKEQKDDLTKQVMELRARIDNIQMSTSRTSSFNDIERSGSGAITVNKKATNATNDSHSKSPVNEMKSRSCKDLGRYSEKSFLSKFLSKKPVVKKVRFATAIQNDESLDTSLRERMEHNLKYNDDTIFEGISIFNDTETAESINKKYKEYFNEPTAKKPDSSQSDKLLIAKINHSYEAKNYQEKKEEKKEEKSNHENDDDSFSRSEKTIYDLIEKADVKLQEFWIGKKEQIIKDLKVDTEKKPMSKFQKLKGSPRSNNNVKTEKKDNLSAASPNFKKQLSDVKASAIKTKESNEGTNFSFDNSMNSLAQNLSPLLTQKEKKMKMQASQTEDDSFVFFNFKNNAKDNSQIVPESKQNNVSILKKQISFNVSSDMTPIPKLKEDNTINSNSYLLEEQEESNTSVAKDYHVFDDPVEVPGAKSYNPNATVAIDKYMLEEEKNRSSGQAPIQIIDYSMEENKEATLNLNSNSLIENVFSSLAHDNILDFQSESSVLFNLNEEKHMHDDLISFNLTNTFSSVESIKDELDVLQGRALENLNKYKKKEENKNNNPLNKNDKYFLKEDFTHFCLKIHDEISQLKNIFAANNGNASIVSSQAIEIMRQNEADQFAVLVNELKNEMNVAFGVMNSNNLEKQNKVFDILEQLQHKVVTKDLSNVSGISSPKNIIETERRNFATPIEAKSREYAMPAETKSREYTTPIVKSNKNFITPAETKSKESTMSVETSKRIFATPAETDNSNTKSTVYHTPDTHRDIQNKMHSVNDSPPSAHRTQKRIFPQEEIKVESIEIMKTPKPSNQFLSMSNDDDSMSFSLALDFNNHNLSIPPNGGNSKILIMSNDEEEGEDEEKDYDKDEEEEEQKQEQEQEEEKVKEGEQEEMEVEDEKEAKNEYEEEEEYDDEEDIREMRMEASKNSESAKIKTPEMYKSLAKVIKSEPKKKQSVNEVGKPGRITMFFDSDDEDDDEEEQEENNYEKEINFNENKNNTLEEFNLENTRGEDIYFQEKLERQSSTNSFKTHWGQYFEQSDKSNSHRLSNKL